MWVIRKSPPKSTSIEMTLPTMMIKVSGLVALRVSVFGCKGSVFSYV